MTRILWRCGVACALAWAMCPAAGAAQRAPTAAPGAAIALPSNLAAAAVFQSSLDRMWRSSPTFKAQCRRLRAAHGLSVVLRLEESQRRPSFSARTVFRRENGVLIAADVFLSRSPDTIELIAHEVEHVLEQLDDVDLATQVGAGQVWKRPDGAFETQRAIDVGRRVARDVARGPEAREGAR